MFRKILLSTLAALGLMAAVVAPTQAYPHYAHHDYHSHHVRAWEHREFCSWAEANAWIGFQRGHGCEVRYEWHGPHVWVFYR